MHLPIGTIVSDTVKIEDRFAALLCTVSDCDLEDENLSENIAQFTELWDKREGDEEAGAELLEGLCTLAEEYLAPYTYLGTLEGDGADFGVWPCLDSLEEAERHHGGEVLRIDGVPDYFMRVSDHGNVTLYRVTVEEVWSIV